MLPAYCDPPNPCPIGYTEADGCIEDFENTSDFSRQYQVFFFLNFEVQFGGVAQCLGGSKFEFDKTEPPQTLFKV